MSFFVGRKAAIDLHPSFAGTAAPPATAGPPLRLHLRLRRAHLRLRHRALTPATREAFGAADVRSWRRSLRLRRGLALLARRHALRARPVHFRRPGGLALFTTARGHALRGRPVHLRRSVELTLFTAARGHALGARSVHFRRPPGRLSILARTQVSGIFRLAAGLRAALETKVPALGRPTLLCWAPLFRRKSLRAFA